MQFYISFIPIVAYQEKLLNQEMPLIKLKPAENEYLRLYILLASTPLTSIGREGLENSSKQSQDLNDNKIA